MRSFELQMMAAVGDGHLPHGYPTRDELHDYFADHDCYDMSHGVASQWPELEANGGYFIRDDGTPADHYWNRHSDGTIIDVTGSQFGHDDYVIDPDHALYDRYVSYEHEPEQAMAAAHAAGHHDHSPQDYADACPQCAPAPRA